MKYLSFLVLIILPFYVYSACNRNYNDVYDSERDARRYSQILKFIRHEDEECTKKHANEITEKYTNAVDNPFFKCFWRYDKIQLFLKSLTDHYSKYIKAQSIGKTYEGQDIMLYRITLTKEKPKPIIYIQGTMHAREWISPPSVLYTMSSILDDMQSEESSVYKLLEKIDFAFVPVLNVDGYRYSWADILNRFWRKNRRPIPDSYHIGVDLNRNFGSCEKFNCPKYTDPRSNTYCGPAHAEENETSAVKNFLNSANQVVGIIDVHAAIPAVLYPPGNGEELKEQDKEMMFSVSNAMGNAISEQSELDPYLVKQASYYGAEPGAFDDYGYSTYKIPSLTLELRKREGPHKNSPLLFVPEASRIGLSGRETYHGTLAFVKETLKYVKIITPVDIPTSNPSPKKTTISPTLTKPNGGIIFPTSNPSSKKTTISPTRTKPNGGIIFPTSNPSPKKTTISPTLTKPNVRIIFPTSNPSPKKTSCTLGRREIENGKKHVIKRKNWRMIRKCSEGKFTCTFVRNYGGAQRVSCKYFIPLARKKHRTILFKHEN